ncbi:MAG: hypothetical protein JOZ97_01380, partial [Candidatus Eremiobacteraeota bacterium]|nr:hypothetical protein [Candidatus Eremiobacteraeota bacterium]
MSAPEGSGAGEALPRFTGCSGAGSGQFGVALGDGDGVTTTHGGIITTTLGCPGAGEGVGGSGVGSGVGGGFGVDRTPGGNVGTGVG